MFTAGYDTTGAALWGLQAGGAAYEQAGKVVGTATGAAYTTGSYDTQAMFTGWQLDAVGGSDLFLAKVGEMATALPSAVLDPAMLTWDPATGLLTITDDQGSGTLTGLLQVMDAAGRLVRALPVRGQRTLALGTLVTGLYMLRLTTPGGSCLLRIAAGQ